MSSTTRSNNQQGSRPNDRTGVTPRPRAGRPYAASYVTNDETFLTWTKFEVPGGRKLWCRLVTAFTITAIFGAILLVTGAVFVKQLHDNKHKDRVIMPLTLCVIAMVCGSLLIIGSIVLGKMMISNKWRRNIQPTYSRHQITVHYRPAPARPRGASGERDIESPPPYEPQVFFIDAEGGALSLPKYEDISNGPPGYSVTDPKDKETSTSDASREQAHSDLPLMSPLSRTQELHMHSAPDQSTAEHESRNSMPDVQVASPPPPYS